MGLALYGDSRIYLSGGLRWLNSTLFIHSNAVWFYDLRQNSIIEAPRLKNARAGHTSTCLGTDIYVFGGICFDSPKA